MNKTIHYSVQNGGDGSAYPVLFESAELAELDQSLMSEGWGESCTGTIQLKSDSPITILDEVKTLASMIAEAEDDEDDELLAKLKAFKEGQSC